MKVQLREIAMECGVSSMTVSRALDPLKSHLVSEKRRKEILECCEKHGYAPNCSASNLATGRSCSVGLIQARGQLASGSRTYGKMINYLSVKLQKYNYFLSLLPIEADDQTTIDQELVRAFRSGRVDGYISLSGYIGEGALKEMAERRFPIVTFNMPSDIVQENPDLRHVRIDSARGVEELFAHLHLQGHEKIAYVGKGNLSKRDELYCRFLKSREDFLRLDDKSASLQSKYLATYRLVTSRWPLLKDYTAVVCSNDEYAAGICEGLKERGLSPGKDMAVAGFDNSEEGQPAPFLTSVHPPIEEAAEACVQMLMAQILKKETVTAPVAVSTRLVIRESTSSYISAKGAVK